jgi:F-type H+-transporting ATPase subunit b
MAEGKKGFIGGKAFWLILGWLVLGGALTAVIYAVSPKMEHACEAWAEEYHLEAHGGHGEAGHDLCHLVGHSDEVKGFTKNLAASFSTILNMKWATAWSIPNFLILITIIWHFAKDPLNENLKNRREELATAIREAEKAKAEAEALKEEYGQKLAEIDREIERVRQEMRDQGEAEKARITEEAERQAERIQNEADFTAKQEVLVAQYRLREEAAKLAVRVAEDVIRQVIDEQDRDRLLGEYLDKVMEQES